MSKDIYPPFEIVETAEINLNYKILTSKRTKGKTESY